MKSCPICNKSVDSFYETDVETPFTHYHPLLGLNIWGPLDADKEVICENNQFVHFVFAGTEHRLVQLATAPQSTLPDDEEDNWGFEETDEDDEWWQDDEEYDEHDEEEFPKGSLDY